MSSSDIYRLSGLPAMLGGGLGIVMAPLLAYSWSTDAEAYLGYGRLYFLVYVASIVGIGAFHSRLAGRAGLRERRGFRVALAGLAIALLGDVRAFWGGGAEEFPFIVNRAWFTVEVLGLLLLLIGSAIVGGALLRTRVVPRWVAWPLVAAGPAGLALSLANIPGGTMAPFSLALAAIGYWLWSAPSGAEGASTV